MKNNGKNWVHYVGLVFAIVVVAAIVIFGGYSVLDYWEFFK